jgi:4-diphosphocytidyl-2-C-methyl-D-erythritol kinase
VKHSAPAKVNLGLRLLRRREDGYHELETFLHTLRWGDELELERATGVQLELREASDNPLPGSTARVPVDDGNLAWRAAEAVMASTGCPGVCITLTKRVPPGTGLGGGSSDAAAVLKGLPALYGIDLVPERQQALALRLGADVPFFLAGGCALALGIGERLEPVAPAPGTPVVLAFPRAAVATAAAYRAANYTLTRTPDYPEYVKSHKGIRGIWSQVGLVNDLEAAVLPERPDIAAVIEALRSTDALLVSMAGSGSAVFGLYEEPDRAEAAARTLTAAGITTVRTELG